jgi:hypothetical protein
MSRSSQPIRRTGLVWASQSGQIGGCWRRWNAARFKRQPDTSARILGFVINFNAPRVKPLVETFQKFLWKWRECQKTIWIREFEQTPIRSS